MLFTKEAFDVLRNEGRAMKLIFPMIISMISNGISRRSIVDDDDNELRRMRAEGRVKDSRRRANSCQIVDPLFDRLKTLYPWETPDGGRSA